MTRYDIVFCYCTYIFKYTGSKKLRFIKKKTPIKKLTEIVIEDNGKLFVKSCCIYQCIYLPLKMTSSHGLSWNFVCTIVFFWYHIKKKLIVGEPQIWFAPLAFEYITTALCPITLPRVLSVTFALPASRPDLKRRVAVRCGAARCGPKIRICTPSGNWIAGRLIVFTQIITFLQDNSANANNK